MFGGMTELFQQASKIKGQMKEMQDSLVDKRVEATSGGDMVKVVANGKLRIVSIQIDPALFEKNDRAMVQDLVTAAVNQALHNAQELVTEEMNKVMGGLGPLASMLNGSMPKGGL